MNIKYDESFNWLAVLKDLAAGAPLSRGEHLDLFVLAREWPTCACGQLCKQLPRDDAGRPLDHKLDRLGSRFFNAVGTKHWEEAIRTFQQIEARTEKLLGATSYVV